MAKYDDVSIIGSGGFGDVYVSNRDTDGQMFAKKKLRDTADEAAQKRFVKEVRMLSALDHPHIVRVVAKRLEKPPFFYIMPLYNRSLRTELPSIIGNDGRVYTIFSAILDAMEYAHNQGVIHRDLKPENILMNSDSDLVISDFGLGRWLDTESTRQTQTGFAMGTILYMAPEQLLDAKRADERSDVFTLGRMLYELYTGPLSSAVQDISRLQPAIALIVGRCTVHGPDQRFQTVAQLRQAWLNLFDSKQRKSALEQLLFLRSKFTAPGPHKKNEVKKFVELLLARSDDADIIHDTLMQIDVSVVTIMFKLKPEETRILCRRFVEFATSQDWPFEYTDKIGNRCKLLYGATEDAEIRAYLIICAMEVGISHNRWHVLGIFSDLMGVPKEPGEELALAHLLEKTDSSTLWRAAEYVSVSKLPSSLVQYFASGADDE